VDAEVDSEATENIDPASDVVRDSRCNASSIISAAFDHSASLCPVSLFDPFSACLRNAYTS